MSKSKAEITHVDRSKHLKLSETSTKRGYLVYKSNQIIQESRYELSLQQLKMVCYICSKIKPDAEKEGESYLPQLIYDINMKEYAELCGLTTGGKFYEKTKAVLQSLRDMSVWITLEDGTETTVSWIKKPYINRGKGIIRIELDEDMVPYLFGISKNFTAYELVNILMMKSQYSIRLYELLKSYKNMVIKKIELDKLYRMLMIDKNLYYKKYTNFRRTVLERAIEEINEFTDLNVTYSPIKRGRSIQAIEFYIHSKEKAELIELNRMINEKLNQVSYSSKKKNTEELDEEV